MKRLLLIVSFILLLFGCRNDEIIKIEAVIEQEIKIVQYDDFSPVNMKVYAYFRNSDTIDITDKVTYVVDTGRVGQVEVKVLYGSYSTTFFVTVTERPAEPLEYNYTMFLTTNKVKIAYDINDELDLTNLEIMIRDNFDNRYYPTPEECDIKLIHNSVIVEGLKYIGKYDVIISKVINGTTVEGQFYVIVVNNNMTHYRLDIKNFKNTYLINERVEIENLGLNVYSSFTSLEPNNVIYNYEWYLELNDKKVSSLSVAGKYKLYVEYDTFSEYIYIDVLQKKPHKLDLDIENVRTKFYTNSQFTTEGLKVFYQNDEVDLEECNIKLLLNGVEKENFQYSGIYEVNLSLNGASASYFIMVLDFNTKSMMVYPTVNILGSSIVEIVIPEINVSLYEFNIVMVQNNNVVYHLKDFEDLIFDLNKEIPYVLTGYYKAYIDNEIYTFNITNTDIEFK